MTVEPSSALAVSLVTLLLLTVAVAWWGRIGTARMSAWAAIRAAVQLAVVSGVIALAVQRTWASLAFLAVMFTVAVVTTARSTETLRRAGWVALAMAAGVVPVLGVVFISGTMPWDGRAILPIGGIVIGNMMATHTLTGRRVFSQIRSDLATYEAGLSLGFRRWKALDFVIEPVQREALVPVLDSTKSTGLVTLPGAFIGVLLGGGSALQAAAAQILVLVSILAGDTLVVFAATRLIRAARLLPPDLKKRLRP